MTGASNPPPATRLASRALVDAALGALLGVLPVFLLSAVGVLVREDLVFTESRLGIAVSVFFGVSAIGSIPLGRVIDVLGADRTLGLAAGCSGIALIGIATARTWWALVAWMVGAGIGHTLAQIGANLRLAGGVPITRQGLAFGIKQSSVPAATLTGGLAVPLLALTLGWRWVFVAAALCSWAFAVQKFLARRVTPHPAASPGKKIDAEELQKAPLIVLAVAFAFGGAAVTAMAAFIVEYAVSIGMSASTAGLILAISSVGALVARVLLGWLADRRAQSKLLTIAVMLGIGAASLAILPSVTRWPALAITTLVAYSVGWGWTGLLHFVVVRGNPGAPAAASGFLQAGGAAGGVIGPTAFGFVVVTAGYQTAWLLAAGCLMTAAALMSVGRVVARRAWLPLVASASSARPLEPRPPDGLEHAGCE